MQFSTPEREPSVLLVHLHPMGQTVLVYRDAPLFRKVVMGVSKPSEGMRRVAHVFATVCVSVYFVYLVNNIVNSAANGGILLDDVDSWAFAVVIGLLALIYGVSWGAFRVLYFGWRYVRDGFSQDRTS